MKQGMNTVTFTLDVIPAEVGADPCLLLIDRVFAGNRTRCGLQTDWSSRGAGGIKRLHLWLCAEQKMSDPVAFRGA